MGTLGGGVNVDSIWVHHGPLGLLTTCSHSRLLIEVVLTFLRQQTQDKAFQESK